MIYITDEMKGLDFDTWLDALCLAPVGASLGDPRRDDLLPNEKMYLGLLYHYRLAGEPKVQHTRGIGNHRQPQCMIVGDRLGARLKIKGSPYWDQDPKYRRVRAFSHDRDFLYNVLGKEDDWGRLGRYYVTTYEKDHLVVNCFAEELEEVRPERILCFHKEVFIKIIELWPKSKIRLIEKPNKSEWRTFYQSVKEFLNADS